MAGWSRQEELPCTLVGPRRNRSVSVERFSLLLLEFGEIYFEDYSCIYYPNASTESESIDRKERGRLKVCSRSLIFDPLDHAFPILKIALRDCKKIESRQQQSGTSSSFVVVCSQYTEMLEGNIISPHKFVRTEMRCQFSLSYISVDEVLPQIQTLQRASRLLKAEHQTLVNSIVQERHSKVSFNVSWLEDLYEETVVELSGERVTPLVTNPGRIMLTSSRIYFQPYNNVEVEPVLKLQLSELKYVTKRRYLLRHVGLECLCSSGECMFLVLPSPLERNRLHGAMVAQPQVSLSQDSLEEATLNWLSGDMSNYQYIMLLNFLSDRSFNDIMQYPVMPWVVADYTSSSLDLKHPATFRDLSKPIGALNDERLAFFKERYEQMRGTKFLYGTHYSAPGYVLYYLVRAAPEYLLCLQNGKFDQPNRLFHKISRTWENVNTDHADVKELIPEFYQPPGDFLLNLQNLDLGVRTDGVRVNDVILPPWAKSAEDFTTKLQAALECDYVSSHLHHWIDLFFGYKQRGEEALKADNLFHYLTYEGSFNPEFIRDPEELAAIELQIKEFGQTPKQLFTQPHPRKIVVNKSPAVALVNSVDGVVCSNGDTTQGLSTTSSSAVSQPLTLHSPPPPLHTNSNAPPLPAAAQTPPTNCCDEWIHIDVPPDSRSPAQGSCRNTKCLMLKHIDKVHKEAVSAVGVSHDSKSYFSVSNDKTIKVHTLEDNQLLRSSNISNLPLSSLVILPGSTVVLIGSWDNNVLVSDHSYLSALSTEYTVLQLYLLDRVCSSGEC
jgi:factor associated with neutral sphingomyelinase activation